MHRTYFTVEAELFVELVPFPVVAFVEFEALEVFAARMMFLNPIEVF